jgi:rubrerythrin
LVCDDSCRDSDSRGTSKKRKKENVIMIKDEHKQIEASGDVWEQMGALEAMGVAIYNEQAAHDFYSGLAGVIENESGRKKFRFLAEDEGRHRRDLEERYVQESGGKTFPFDPDRVQKVEYHVENQTGAIDAVELALEAEKAAFEFYTQAAGKTADEGGRRMFERLAADEDGHYEMLLAEREALLGGFYWFGGDEQRVMEG